MMRADYHVHTEYSDDSAYEMEQVVRDAIKKGIDELCFTDHVDYGIKKDWDKRGRRFVVWVDMVSRTQWF
ncbi:MAG: PHP domain-containing protein [Lachnospiraceae bacterium]